MHYSILAAWTGLAIQEGGTWVWLLVIIICCWIGVRWWSARIGKQFEREPQTENEVVKRKEEVVDWKLSGLLKLLLLLFVLACVVLVALL
jgi:hypothetical protein